MKALRFESPGQVKEREIPTPQIARPDDVRVKMEAVSLCCRLEHSFFSGRRTLIPGFPCRGGAGIVEEAGPGNTSLSSGDRVVLSGQLGDLFQESVVFPGHGAQKIESGLAAAALAPSELYARMLALLKRAEKIFRALCVVIGLGPAGLCAVMWLRVLGARQIWALEPNEHRREKGLACGADYVFSPNDKKAMATINGMNPETVIECSGSHSGMTAAMGLAEKDALLFGYNDIPFQVVQSDWSEKNLTIKAQSGFGHLVWSETADYINRSFIDPGRLITDILPFSAAGYSQAMRKIRSPETYGIILEF
ncbi:MAG: zinc-binding dehydrogenase [Candidatus Aminicenantes bacterium]